MSAYSYEYVRQELEMLLYRMLPNGRSPSCVMHHYTPDGSWDIGFPHWVQTLEEARQYMYIHPLHEHDKVLGKTFEGVVAALLNMQHGRQIVERFNEMLRN